MRTAQRPTLVGFLAVGAYLILGFAAKAQDPGLGGILGGYAAMSGSSGMAAGGGYNILDPSGTRGYLIVPAAGGSVPAMTTPSMRGGGLFFRLRPTPSMYATRPSFSLESMGRMGGDLGPRRPFALPGGTLSEGMGLGRGLRRMPVAGGMRVMPPSLSYPFRQPPSLLTPSPSGAGMSM